MYNERNDRFSIKTVIVQFLFVALFIFLLLWLFPTKNYIKDNDETNLDVFYDRIFVENIILMKDSAKSYYTNPRLPQKVGDKVKMTLGEMLDKKIILPFVDKNGETCSLTDAYVEITKYADEYVMKVNLKCSEEENYLLVYMGCYDYCSTTICEKNKEDIKNPVIHPTPKPEPEPQPEQKPTPSVPSCSLKVLSGNKNGNVYTGTVEVGFASKLSGNNATLTGFGLGTSTTYGGQTRYTLTKAGTYKVYGYVKNSFGNTAVCSIDITIENPKPQPTPSVPSCSLKVLSGKKDGNAYTGTVEVGFASKSAGDNATLKGFGLGTSTTYGGQTKYTIKKPGTYKIYGYVKNSFGNTAKCSIDITIQKELEYEYKKVTTSYTPWSNWSEWSTTAKQAGDLVQVENRTTKKTVTTGYKTIYTNDPSKPIYGTKEVVVGKLSEKICTEYGYTETGKIAYSDWTLEGIILDNGNIKSTDLIKYVRVKRDEDFCQEKCSSSTDVFYEKWVRKAISGAVYTCKNYGTTTKLITAQKTIITGYEQIVTKQPITEVQTITEYRYRTRKINTKTDIKWSYKNNKTLLNAGYKYTGNSREK